MKKILIIEDEKILGGMYKEKFEANGFEVFLALDAKEGLEIAKKEKPDLILLDILLPSPKEDGISFLKRRKTEPEISKIPVLVFSNYDDPEVKSEAFELGIEEYLLKTSFTPQQIVEKTKEYLK